ncbi:hypothetical protein TNCV_2569551 [Trichonephila clavipes]|nr:hypothetical protein TNCV_2569551 [Trichonephila clavipes]
MPLVMLLDAAFEQGTGINFLFPPSSVWCCHWPCVATWLMEVGGVSDAGTNGVEEGRLGEPSLPMEWVLGVSIALTYYFEMSVSVACNSFQRWHTEEPKKMGERLLVPSYAPFQ